MRGVTSLNWLNFILQHSIRKLSIMYHAKAMHAFQLSHPYSVSEPFHSQDHMSNSPYCLLYNSYDVSFENLALD